MSNPIVSICIPCFNSENTIGSTIQSVVSQTFSDIEIIVCDNNSTDRTVSVVKHISDSRIRIIVNDSNIGMVNNFHRALSYAKGKYVKCLCADDIITSDCIEKQVSVFLQHPDDNIVMVSAEKNVIDSTGKILFKKPFPGRGGSYKGEKAIKKSFLHGTSIFGEPGCVMFDREASLKTSQFLIDPLLTYVMDFHLYCQLLKQGNLFVIKEPLFSFRVINTSGTAGFKWNQARIFNSLLDKYQEEKFVDYSLPVRFFSKTMAWMMCIARNLVFKFAK